MKNIVKVICSFSFCLSLLGYCFPHDKYHYDTYNLSDSSFSVGNKLIGKHLVPQSRLERICYQMKSAKKSVVPLKVRTLIQDLKKKTEVLNEIKNGRRALSWIQFEEELKKKKDPSFLLMGFGSLLHSCCSYTSDFEIPALVFGVKRTYNILHPHPEKSPMGLPTKKYPHERLRLNTEMVNTTNHFLNGLLLKFTLGTPNYKSLKEREKSYDLIPIKVLEYAALLKGKVHYIDAYILSGELTSKIESKDAPHIVYNEVVLDGSREIETRGNPGFLSLFLESTYMPDGKVPMMKWLEKVSGDS